MGKHALGVNNAWAVKRFAEPASWVEIAASLDIDLVQFSLDLLDPSVDEVVARPMIEDTLDECKKYGIRLHSCFTGLVAYSSNLLLHPDPQMRDWAFAWYSRALAIASEFGVEMVGGHMGAMSSRDYDDPRRRRYMVTQLIEKVRQLTERAQQLKLTTFLWEPMPTSREPPASVAETKTILSRVNKGAKVPVRLCIDVGHACNPRMRSTDSVDPYIWLEELGKESPCIHIQQTDGIADRHWPFTPDFNRVGIIKPEKVISSLDKGGAGDVPLFLEAMPAFEQPEEGVIGDLRQSVRYWKEYL